MIPVWSSPLLLFSKVMRNGCGNCLQTEETITLITANFMCGKFASVAKSAKCFIFLKMRTLILQKVTGNIRAAFFSHLTNT